MTPVDAEAVASAVLACPDVAGLASGTAQDIATYLPGRRVSGVRISDDAVEVQVVARWGPPLPAVGDQVRAAVVPLAGGRPVTVAIQDVQVPGDEVEAPTAQPAP